MSLIELMFMLAVAVIGLGLALPALLSTRDDWVARQAASYMVAQLMLARSESARFGAAVGIRFEPGGNGIRMSKYLDGDGDGIRSRDITAGVDRSLGGANDLGSQYSAVRIGFVESVPPVGASKSGGALDPVRFGPGDILTFGPLGTATAGTVYLAGPRQQQYAVRVLGVTGRIRVMRFDPRLREWQDE